MISQTAIASRPLETWRFTIDTRLVDSSNCIAAVPFTLYTQPNIYLEVDWGDGSKSILSESNWTGWDTDGALHTYASPGTYQIKIRSCDWQWCYIDTLTYNNLGMCTTPNTDTSQRYTKICTTIQKL